MTLGLRFGHEGTIPGGEFFRNMLEAAAQAAERQGYGLLICRADSSALVDAHLVVDPSEDDDLPESGKGVPVVTVGRSSVPGVPWVDVDHEKAMKTLLTHLDRDAHEGPVWMVTLRGHLAFVGSLESACRAWASDAGRDCVFVPTGAGGADVVTRVSDQLSRNEQPALVVTALDWQAIGAQHALSGAGISVPIGSASDGEALSLVSPPISAMALDGSSHGRVAVGMLFDWLRSDEVPQSRTLPARLRAR
jgi:DNA-binding LacI/PurR family transcriptional regulator